VNIQMVRFLHRVFSSLFSAFCALRSASTCCGLSAVRIRDFMSCSLSTACMIVWTSAPGSLCVHNCSQEDRRTLRGSQQLVKLELCPC
jgi:hypothetical protein